MSTALAIVEDETIETASGAERMLACTASAVLVRARDNSAIAQRGTEFHSYVQAVLGGVPKDQALARVGKSAKEMCEGLDFQKALGGLLEARSEVPLILNLTDAPTVSIPKISGRAYPPGPWTQVPGTADIVGRTFTHKPSVRDWKTGFGDTTEPYDNWQLRVYAMGAALAAQADVCEVQVIHVRPSGKVWLEGAEFDRFDLDRFADELREGLQRVRKARALYAKGHLPVMNVGDHCTYCPSVTVCPARVALAKGMLADVENVEQSLSAMTPAQQGEVWRKLAVFGSIYDRIKDSLKTAATSHPIPLGGGKEVRAIPFTRTNFDRAGAIALLKAKGATDSEIADLEKEATSMQVREMKVRK